MSGLMGLGVIAMAIWMASDASKLGYDRRDVKGLAAIGPAGWLFAGLFIPLLALPLYLIKRDTLKAAGDRRRAMLRGQVPMALPPGSAGYGAAPGAYPPGYGQAPPQAYGAVPPGPNYPPPQYPQGQAPYGAAPPPPTAPPRLSAEELADQLRKLGELHISGLLTAEEFQQQKMRLLERT